MNKFLAMFPIQASTHAAEVDQMTVLVHWLMLVMFVGWGIFFVFVLFRFRSAANPKASYTGAKGKISNSIGNQWQVKKCRFTFIFRVGFEPQINHSVADFIWQFAALRIPK